VGLELGLIAQPAGPSLLERLSGHLNLLTHLWELREDMDHQLREVRFFKILRYNSGREKLLLRMNELVDTPEYLVVQGVVVVVEGETDIDFIQRGRICISIGEPIRHPLLDLVLQIVHRLILVDVKMENRGAA